MSNHSYGQRPWARLALVVMCVFVSVACSDDSSPSPNMDASLNGDASDGAVSDLEVDQTSSTDLLPSLVWEACETTWAGFPPPSPEARCTLLRVPLDHDQPAGQTLELRVARVQASVSGGDKKAVFFLAGGPGGASVQHSGVMPLYLPELAKTHDMVFVDQRGTGGSGFLACSQTSYPNNPAEWSACAQEHSRAERERHLTAAAAEDLELVRKTLGYTKIALRGGSYGTRLALEYLRRHGANVSAAVLDGVAPPNYDYFDELVTYTDRGVALLAKDCSADPACKALNPDVAADLDARRKALPRTVMVNGSKMTLGEGSFVELLGNLVGVRASWRYAIPRAIREAVSGDNTRWNGLLSQASGLTIKDATVDRWPRPRAHGAAENATLPRLKSVLKPSRRTIALPARPPQFLAARPHIAPGLFATVVCTEFEPNSAGLVALRALLAKQQWAGDETLALAESCADWSASTLPQTSFAPVQSDAPVLLLSGELDLITPPHWGDEAAAALSKGTHLRVPYTPHSTISVPCVRSIISAFIVAGSMSSVDTSCLSQMSPPAW